MYHQNSTNSLTANMGEFSWLVNVYSYNLFDKWGLVIYEYKHSYDCDIFYGGRFEWSWNDYTNHISWQNFEKAVRNKWYIKDNDSLQKSINEKVDELRYSKIKDYTYVSF